MYKYQSLEAWKRAHAAVVLVLRTTDAGNRPRHWALFDQLRRAVISVEANIVEGYALSTHPLFIRHLRIALGSAAEAECLVRIASEMKYMSDDAAKEIEALLGGAMRTLHGLMQRRSGTVR